MSWLGLLVALLYLAIHIASIVAKEAQKRKERVRLMEQAERRRMTEARLELPGPEEATTQLQPSAWQRPGVARPPAPPPPSSRSRNGPLDDLAARRKQQLEQLRNRPAPAPVQRPHTPQPSRTDLPPSARMPTAQGRIETESERLRRESATRTSEQQRAARQRSALAKAQKLQQAQREAEQQRKAELHAMATSFDAPHLHAAPITHHKPSTAIMAKLKDRNTLREVFVLREVIDPPLALREQAI